MRALIDIEALVQLQEASFARAGGWLRSSWTVAGSRLRNLEQTPWASIVIAEGDGSEHRAVTAGGTATITAAPSEEVLSNWAARHGSPADWAAAWFEIRPTRLVSHAAGTGAT